MVRYSLRLILLTAILISFFNFSFGQNTIRHGGIVRGDKSKKQLSLVLTGHEYAEGGMEILEDLARKNVKASFFFTGDFYRNSEFEPLIKKIRNRGHYLGAHSDKHLLYCSWEDREHLLVDRYTFSRDILENYVAMKTFGIEQSDAPYFLPPYEWYNENVSIWAKKLGFQIINFSPGIRTHADYTDPSMPNYVSSDDILESIWDFEAEDPNGLNGFILLFHIGVGDKRSDKFYKKLPDLLKKLEKSGYEIVSLDKLLKDY